ncbi:hypothetical protein L916_04868 [Phytophthora nicotianae]|uniref:Uncharacterized protein n=1 Tax=Phytophthora nicotianae TaxID=4792 RepID=W2JH64_PHYNI|nr:hypothetical protein L916_04868 [Phytophthora nicotianae]
MEQCSALPSINGKFSDPPTTDILETRPTSGVFTVRRALGMIPKSAGATSVARRTRHSEVAMISSWQQHESLLQRPSSSNVTSRNASTERRTERDKQPGNAIQNDSTDAFQRLRNDNALFRQENDLLRAKLVEKMRGQSKVVAGGQYRATSASPVAKVPPTPNSGCSKCSIARARAIKAHQESEQAHAATAELREYVDKIEASQHKLWEERSCNVNEIAKLREKLAEKAEHCILVETECAKLDKQVKRLQSEIDSTKFTQPFVEQEIVDNATQCTLQQSYDEESMADQQCEIEILKGEVQLLKQQRDEREQDLDKVSKTLEEIQMAMKLEKEQRDSEKSACNGEISQYKRRVLELEEINKTLQVSVQDIHQSREKELQLIQRANQETRDHVIAKEAEIQQLVKQHKTETLAVEQRNQTLIKALKVRIAQKVADVERLHALLAHHSTVKKENEAMKTRILDLEERIQYLISSNDLQQQQTVDLAQIERDKLLSEGAAEQHRLSEALNTLQQENRSLKTRISEVEAELADRDELMQSQKRSHERALECLVESSLRLCVVAPTVNVQLNTNGANKLNVSKDSSELASIMCRSTPQQDRIKCVIENDVLPQFTSVFLQEDDNASPQADVPMTRWLQELLQDMQARIATQLENIYSTTSGSSNE